MVAPVEDDGHQRGYSLDQEHGLLVVRGVRVELVPDISVDDGAVHTAGRHQRLYYGIDGRIILKYVKVGGRPPISKVEESKLLVFLSGTPTTLCGFFILVLMLLVKICWEDSALTRLYSRSVSNQVSEVREQIWM